MRSPFGLRSPLSEKFSESSLENLILNGSDWVGATGSTPPDDWVSTGGGLFTITPEGWLEIERTVGVVDTDQFFATEVGEDYTVTFSLKNFVEGICRFQIKEGTGGVLSTADYTVAADSISTSFTATETTSSVRFRNVGTASSTWSLDNVTCYKD